MTPLFLSLRTPAISSLFLWFILAGCAGFRLSDAAAAAALCRGRHKYVYQSTTDIFPTP